MSNFQTITPVVEGLAGSAPQIWSAVTTDNLAAVTAAGYLNDIAFKLGIKANDTFFVNISDLSTFPMQTGLNATLMELQVTYSAPNWSLIVSNPEGFTTYTMPSVVNAISFFTNTTGNLGSSPFLASGRFFLDTASDALTAHAGGGQGSALALTSDVNRVTTVATAGDSVKLFASAPGAKALLINSGANPMQVFGNGTDTINDVATATGVSQLPNSACWYSCSVAGKWYSNDVSFGFSGNLQTLSWNSAVTAHAGGTQAAAVLLTGAINQVTTVATAADSVKLEPAFPGMEQTVINSGANAMQVYGSGTDTINSVATATGVSQNAGTIVTYRCVVAGNWLAVLPPLASTVMLTTAVNQMAAGGAVLLDKGTATSTAGAATVNKQAGVITTESLSTASGAAYAFTLTNSEITTSSIVICTLLGGTNTKHGLSFTSVPGSGSAAISILNNDISAAALNGTLIFGFVVL